jgi:hypothetical protein
MKRKVIAVIFLVLLLIGIAYVRALFSHQERHTSLSPEVAKVVPAELLDDYLSKEQDARGYDSLKQAYSDSLTRLNESLTGRIDSLPQAQTDSLQTLIGQLQQRLSVAEEDVREAECIQAEQFEKLIAAFYKGEVSKLPADLSSYEREVSIKEIKNKAREYFGLSE